MNLGSSVRSKGHLGRNAEESWCHGATNDAKWEETSRKTKLICKVQGDGPTKYPVWIINQKHFQKHVLTFLQEMRNLHITALLHELKHLVKISFLESLSLQSPFLTNFALWKVLQQVPEGARASPCRGWALPHSATESSNSYSTECLWHRPFTTA